MQSLSSPRPCHSTFFWCTNLPLMKFAGFLPAFAGNAKQLPGLCFPFFPQWGHSERLLPFLRPCLRLVSPPVPTPPVSLPPVPPPLLLVPVFAAVVAAANTLSISFFISVMSCWQKSFIMLVVSALLEVLLADLVVTANTNSRSVVRCANVSSRAEMYALLSVLMELAVLVGGPAYAPLSYAFAIACNQL